MGVRGPERASLTWVPSAASSLSRKSHRVVAGVSDHGSDEEAVQVLRITEVPQAGRLRRVGR